MKYLRTNPLVRELGEDNEDGIIYGDIFYLCYYGINVFLKVCRTSPKQVAVYELAKKKLKGNKEGIILKPTKAPVLVADNNCPSKSNFWARTRTERGNIYIDVDVPYNSLLVKRAHDMGFPLVKLCVSAIHIKEEQENGVLNYYWKDLSYQVKRKNSENQAKKQKSQNIA